MTTPHTKYIRKTKPANRGQGFLNMTPEQQAKAQLRQRTPIEVRFWWDVEKTASCWLWKGALLASGHGQLMVRGKMRKAHHISLELIGLEPRRAGFVVDHICRVRNCVNPEHLRIVPEGVNSIENNLSPYARNRQKTHCKNGHPFIEGNFVWIRKPSAKTRHGTPTKPKPCRACIVCRPYLARSAYRVAGSDEYAGRGG